MIVGLDVPLTIDRPRAVAGIGRERSRARWWLAGGALALLGGIGSVTAGALSAAGARDPAIAGIGLAVGIGPLVGGALLVRGALPARWRAHALDLAVRLAEARGGVSTHDLAPLVDQPVEEVAALLATVATSQRLGWTPPPPFGRSDPRRYAAFRSSRLVRALALAVASSPFLLVAGILWVLALVAILQAELVVAPVMLLAGFGPGLPGLVIAWRARVALRDRQHVGRLVAALLAPSVESMDVLCSRTGLKADAVRGLARAALEAGVLDREVGGKLGLLQIQAPVATLGAVAGAASGAPVPWMGQVLKGAWLVEAPLGAGGMGTVFRGRDVQSGRPVAIKVVSTDALDDDAFRRFHREAQALATVRHPHVVALRDYDRTPQGALYLVMDLLDGDTLETVLQRSGRLPLADALSIAVQIAGALGAAHAAGLLHRDVKPSNVLVSGGPGAPRATLIDFGLVRSVNPGAHSRVTTRGQVVGTPLYMSPEQARGDGVDARSDLYSLAVVTYEMVTGVPPFFDPSIAVVYAKLLSGEVPSIQAAGGIAPAAGGGMEDQLDHILQGALAPLAADRPPSVEAFAAALARVAPAAAPPRAAAI